jgi:hypothetical protein
LLVSYLTRFFSEDLPHARLLQQNSVLRKSTSPSVLGLLFHEFTRMTFESFFALYAAEVVGFSVMCDLELGSVFVQYCTANWVSWHSYVLYLTSQ